jgi:hypothetical protein
MNPHVEAASQIIATKKPDHVENGTTASIVPPVDGDAHTPDSDVAKGGAA